MNADVTPIRPTGAEAWRRIQLARSLIAHRRYTAETAVAVDMVLRGHDIDDLIQQPREEASI